MTITNTTGDTTDKLLDDIKKRANISNNRSFIQKESINDMVNSLGKIFREGEYAIRQTSEDTYIIKIELKTDSMIDFDDIEKLRNSMKKTLGNFDVSFFGVSPNGNESLILSFWTFEL